MLIKNLKTYFKEKNLSYELFEIENEKGQNFIDNETVIDSIGKMPVQIQNKIRDQITKIDFKNGNINAFLKYIAEKLVNQ